jgi:hypothetical protein
MVRRKATTFTVSSLFRVLLKGSSAVASDWRVVEEPPGSFARSREFVPGCTPNRTAQKTLITLICLVTIFVRTPRRHLNDIMLASSQIAEICEYCRAVRETIS